MDSTFYKTTAEYRLGAIQRSFDRHGITFSKREASKLLGGASKLRMLIETGAVRVEKHNDMQNSRWCCCGGDVLRNMIR